MVYKKKTQSKIEDQEEKPKKKRGRPPKTEKEEEQPIQATFHSLPWLTKAIDERISVAKKKKEFKIEFLLPFNKEDSVYRMNILHTLKEYDKKGYETWAAVSIKDEETLQYRVSIEWQERL